MAEPVQRSVPDPADRPDINVETVCRVVVKAAQFDAKADAVNTDPASNATDDGFRGVLEDDDSDPVQEELRTLIDGLDVDARIDLVALMFVGRGDFDAADWPQARQLAAEQKEGADTASYLLGTPLLSDYLREGLAAFGLSCGGEEPA